MGFGKQAARYWQAAKTQLLPIQGGEKHTIPGQLVVSLTSYPARYRTLHLTLRSLLSQDVKPDLLVLWIAHDDFKLLPATVTRLQDRGLLIRQCADQRQYKKIIPALQAYPEAFIVTADDDNYYPRDWLRQLVEAYRDNREILCRRARVTLESGGKFTSYETWKEAKRDGESGSHLFFTGVGGVLYPPNSLAPQTTDAAEFMRLCPNNDDIWLNWMAALAGTRVRVVKPLKLLAWPGSQGVALWRINRVQGENDPQLTAMTAAYGLPSTLAQTPAMTG